MLKATNLHKEYGSVKALQGVDLQVKSGEIYALLGPNGAGKTTTINLFLGFLKPTSGEVWVEEVNVGNNPLLARRLLGYIPENVTLYPHLSGIENLEYFSGLAGHHYSVDSLIQFLNESGLPETAFKRRVETYSKGMRQKVGIAIALAKKAKALLLDEPTSGLDPQASNDFSGLISSISLVF